MALPCPLIHSKGRKVILTTKTPGHKEKAGMSSFLERYNKGEFEQVWDELLAPGAKVREEPLYSEALPVIYETMRRARQNIETLVERLKAINYQFEYPEQVLIPPGPDVDEQVAKIEGLVGPTPLSIKFFYKIVGSANFMGFHPELSDYSNPGFRAKFEGYSDPLVVDPVESFFTEYDIWKNSLDDEDASPAYLPIAPDDYHKANVSGGPFYLIELPDARIDAPLKYEWHNTTFVNYLRICFKWGGFPGFERYSYRSKELEFLAEGLLPL